MPSRFTFFAPLLLAPLACGPSIVVPSDVHATTDAGTTSEPPPAPPPTLTTDDGDPIPEPEPDSSSGSLDETTHGFIMEHDHGEWYECDIFLQDCPRGEKCMPWANDGGSAWNATRCSPVAEAPGAPGEPCTVEGTATSGIDDCQLGAMCFWVDPETDEGTCVAMCTGSPEAPTCDDPATQCNITGSGVIAQCLGVCDPLLQDCPEGSGCYPTPSYWECIPDGSEGMGQLGDSCAMINGCAPYLVCVDSTFLPGCTDPTACCTEVCDLEDPQCTTAGHECTPWYERGSAPPGFEHVGVCVVPP